MPKARLPQPETTIEDIIAGKNSEVAAAAEGGCGRQSQARRQNSRAAAARSHSKSFPTGSVKR